MKICHNQKMKINKVLIHLQIVMNLKMINKNYKDNNRKM